MHIAIVLNDLAMGGTQRLVVGLATHLHAHGHRVEVFTFARTATPRFFKLAPEIGIHDLDLFAASRGTADAVWQNWLRLRRIRAEVRRARPALVVSFLATINVTVLLAVLGLRLPVIVCEESDPVATPIPRPWRWFRYATYRLSRRIVVHSTHAADYFRPLGLQRLCVIANPIAPCSDDPDGCPEFEVPEKTILAMGRLAAQKGFDILIESFSRIAGRHPDWHLMILGEGEERQALEQLVMFHGLGHQINLPGAVRFPGRILKQGRFFVSSSRYEGFGLALGEAMACGLPVVATDAPSGPSDIVRPGVDGLLVPVGDSVALADAMLRLIEAPELLAAWSSAARNVVERFSAMRIWSEWDALIAAVNGQRWP